MKKLSLVALLALMTLGSLSACAQSVDDARKERIIENLKYQFPQLREYEVTMQELVDSGVPGLQRGSFLIAGQQEQDFLVTDAGELYLVAAGPVDVSLTAAEIAARMEEERAAEAAEAQARQAELDAFIAGQPVRGNPDASVTIIEFSDFQCPYCQRAAGTVERLIDERADVKLVYLHFPLNNHPWARPAAIASICAARQDDAAFWMLHDAYFANQRQLNPGNVLEKSREFLAGTNVDLGAWAVCAEDSSSEAYREANAEITAAMRLGQQFGVTGTPAFFVNGVFLSGAQPYETFVEAIEQVQGSGE